MCIRDSVMIAHRTEVRDRGFFSALRRRLSTVCPPKTDSRDLWNLLHFHHRAEDRIAERDVFDRVLRRRHGARELARPLVPRFLSPEVVYPQEAALLQIETQRLHFFFR